MSERQESGLKERVRLDEALSRLRAVVDPVDRTERVPVTSAVGRVLGADVTADRAIPHYDRAAMDGFAVRARDTFDATDRSPAVLRVDDAVEPGSAVRVHTGSELPEGANAVVRVEDTTLREEAGEVEVETAVPDGENVAPAGEDVAAGATVFEAGRRLRESDLGLCKAVGRTRVEVVARPTVGVVPTGEELVEADPQPGEVVETNGLTAATFVGRWGGKPTYRDPVTDDRHALRAAIERDLTKDLVVTTGGTSVGERDLLPEVVDELGEVLVHGVALKPGHPVGFGVVRETPVLMLPGYPVSCLVTAVQLLRPAVKRAGRLPVDSHPERPARLTDKIASEVGVRTFARVSVTDVTVEPIRSAGAGVMSSVAAADGWVVVPETREGIPAGETVTVQDWEYQP